MKNCRSTLSDNVANIKTELGKLNRSRESFKNLGEKGYSLAANFQKIMDQIDLVAEDVNRLRAQSFI